VNLYLSLNKALTLYPNREAIADGAKRFTYEQFGGRVSALTHVLSGLRMRKGAVVAMLAPNCHEYMEAYYACAVLGVILNPLNFRLSPHELVDILDDSEAEILITHCDFAEHVTAMLSQSSQVKHVIWFGAGKRPKLGIPALDYEEVLAERAGCSMLCADVENDDIAQLYYTSGTTGRSKGVMLTHGNVASNALGAVCELKLSDADVWAHVAPMFHLVDAWAVFAITWIGGKHVFLPYFKANEVLPLIQAEAVTLATMVPTMVNSLLGDPALKQYSYESLRMILTAGSPVAPEQVRRVVDEFDCDYLQFYGMTETSPFLTVSIPKSHMLDWPLEKLLQVKSRTGRPFIGVEVKVVRADGSEVETNDLEVGEVVARGPNVMKGYWNKPDATKEAIRGGWMHTGDLAVVDSEGYINVVDRKKDMIITGGENVYSTEVEYAIYEHPEVIECAVLGIPDPDWGEKVKAFVVTRSGAELDEAELIKFVKERIAGYKAPRSVEFLKELPKTGSGKIYKKGLRDQYWHDREKQIN